MYTFFARHGNARKIDGHAIKQNRANLLRHGLLGFALAIDQARFDSNAL